MQSVDQILLILGLVFLLGLAADFLGRATSLPRVTLLILLGVLIGPFGLSMIPESSSSWIPLVTEMALLLVGFLIGGKISIKGLAAHGKTVLFLSLSVVIVTIVVVAGGLLLSGSSLIVALLLAGIATATDPAATMDVVREGNASGEFTDTLVSIVAIDDAWGLIAFSIILALTQLASGSGVPAEVLIEGSRELVGSILLGVGIGFPAAMLSGRIKRGEPTLVEALGVVFLCGGLAGYFDVSFLLTAMVLGATVSNLARHHDQPFHEIEDIEWPFMILFFVFTGASLAFDHISEVLVLTTLFIVLRIVARAIGPWPAIKVARLDPAMGKWMGLSLLPQAGVANGMALLAGSTMPELKSLLLSVTVLATVFFELAGPIVTRHVLKKVGDII